MNSLRVAQNSGAWLLVNLAGLGVGTLRTEVAWEDALLLGFFHHQGFKPAPRLCLELPVRHRP